MKNSCTKHSHLHTLKWFHRKTVSLFFSQAILLFLRLYQNLLSPVLHLLLGSSMGCRFSPSCSHYMSHALTHYGILQGMKLSFQRLLRCHPWSSGGYDPIPMSTIPISSTLTTAEFQNDSQNHRKTKVWTVIQH